ncbi:MAG: Inosine-5'-monophosphate dehydrogenase [Candidatus Bathyarchaeota archaeon BA2]|nr:MAG: Inosine-5'-monophosphate dehydrogenase [Candidatus Bathyarchaeota archaeon BA2]
MSLKMENVMVTDVVTVEAEATVREVVELMNKNEIGCLVVVDEEEKPVGIITERDLLKRVLAKRKDPVRTKVKDIMSEPLVTGTPHMDVEAAVRLMFKHKIKKLPVVENSQLVGLVTLTDLVRFQPQIIRIPKKLSSTQLPPKHMKKVIDYYVV